MEKLTISMETYREEYMEVDGNKKHMRDGNGKERAMELVGISVGSMNDLEWN